ncbi:uncharacterized protein LOC121369990 [Gigantopelta aegis]|uniref:uncharacterized protein LOC121369990 n=1 Tax=Gigantopelta aegis TaxID=1735272 RepID=UPI001B889281|nr:uncharacterized protein LOC121369990 [Gigantopelta aegis]
MTLFRPGMNADIKKSVTNCSTCQMHRHMNQKETLIKPTTQYQAYHGELLNQTSNNFDVREYVLVVDYYSNYPEVEHLPDTRSRTAINKIKRILARHGKCQKLVSDNCPQYSSSEFNSFAKEWDFNHIT